MSRSTLDPAVPSFPSPTGLSPALAGLSRSVWLEWSVTYAVRTPERTRSGLGSSPFARRYSENHFCFLFLRLLRCFSSPGSLRMTVSGLRLTLSYGDGGLPRRVSPFRHLRVTGYLLLTAAFRSLSRLSSALSAKASTLCSFLLNLFSGIALPAQVGSFLSYFFSISDVYLLGASSASGFFLPLWILSLILKVFSIRFSRYRLSFFKIRKDFAGIHKDPDGD